MRSIRTMEFPRYVRNIVTLILKPFAKSIPNYELRVNMRLPMVMTIVITAGPWKYKSLKVIPARKCDHWGEGGILS